MTEFFEFWQHEVDAFRGVEVQVCGKTKTVQLHAWDHGDPENQQSAALTLDKARELMAWLQDAIAKADAAAQPDAEERGVSEAAINQAVRALMMHKFGDDAAVMFDIPTDAPEHARSAVAARLAEARREVLAVAAALSAAHASAPAAPEVVGILRDMTALFEMTDEAQQPGTDSYTVLWQAREFLRAAREGN